MPSTKRCVFGCFTAGVTIHNFPNPIKYPERFKQWLNIVGEPLFGLSDADIYGKKKVCDRHFTDKDRNRNSRLNALAVPSLYTSQIFHEPYVMSHEPAAETSKASSSFDQTLSLPTTSQILTGSGNHPRSRNNGYIHGQKSVRDLKREIIRLKRSRQNLKSRLEMVEKFNNHIALDRVTKRMNISSKIFTRMLYREASKKPRGRRFTLKEKILSLSFYKRSPKCYKLLSKCFTLPAAKTLRNLLNGIKMKAGINKPIFKKIKESVQNMSGNEKLCILIFDEMHINPQIQYNSSKDEFTGFESIKNKKIADHVLTFMIRGICKKYKQPVAYYFTTNLSKFVLKTVIKEVIREVSATGLKIIGTVCDQSTVNVGAIDSLISDSKELYLRSGREWRNDIIIIDQLPIIPLYDVPHLIKGLRNNLLTKNLKYVDQLDKTEKIIKWDHFIQIYNADMTCGELKILQKITEEHVIPEKINKMKVKLATQLFSHSVAIATKHLCDAKKLDPDCENIINFVLMMDKLFDSLNAGSFAVTNGKMYRAGVRRNSPHHKLWHEGIEFLKNVTFLKVCHGNPQLIECKVPSIQNFIKTIEGMQAIWKLVNQRHGLQCMLTRNFNQDPIENFFGSIRSLGVRNVSPNAENFEGAYKSLLLSNFSSSQSIKSNCEDDCINSYIQSLDFLLKDSQHENVHSNADLLLEINLNEDILQGNNAIHEAGLQQRSYVCGWVLKRCLKNICKTCKPCRNQLLANENIRENTLIKDKEYLKKKWLVYPSKEIHEYFFEIQNITTLFLKENFTTKNIKINIKNLAEILTDFKFNCQIHKSSLKKYFEESVINVLIYSWCRTINRILSGKVTYDGDDEIKKNAQIYYNKHKHNKSKK